MCIRFDIYGCTDVPPPTLVTEDIVTSYFDVSSLPLQCSATGMLGMALR